MRKYDSKSKSPAHQPWSLMRKSGRSQRVQTKFGGWSAPDAARRGEQKQKYLVSLKCPFWRTPSLA